MKAQDLFKCAWVGISISAMLNLSCMTRSEERAGACVKASAAGYDLTPNYNSIRAIPGHYLPFPKGSGYLISNYPGYDIPNTLYDSHRRADMLYSWDFLARKSASVGVEIIASVDGCIRNVKRNSTVSFVNSPSAANNVNYVNLVWDKAIADQYEVGAKIESVYLHLASVHNNIQPGVCVKRGTPLGITGCSGWCTGIHLHYQVQRSPAGGYWNTALPITFVEKPPYAITNVFSANDRNEVTQIQTQNQANGNTGTQQGSGQGNGQTQTRPQTPIQTPTQQPSTGTASNAGTSSNNASSNSEPESDFATDCQALGARNQYASCASRIAGGSQRTELLSCKSEQIEYCILGCKQANVWENDSCVLPEGKTLEELAPQDEGGDPLPDSIENSERGDGC